MRFPLPITALVALTLVGCASATQKQAKLAAKMEKQEEADNSRRVEQQRMLAVENREANSARGAEVIRYDKNKQFDLNNATPNARSFGTSKASTKDYYSDRKMHLDTYQTRDFHDSKPNQAAQRAFATKDAPTKGKFLNLFASKTAQTKTAATKEAWDANKGAPTRPLSDGRRQYLGQESQKMNTQISAAELANWRNGGETVGYGDGTIEKMSTMKQLSIDDVRELLNKSK